MAISTIFKYSSKRVKRREKKLKEGNEDLEKHRNELVERAELSKKKDIRNAEIVASAIILDLKLKKAREMHCNKRSDKDACLKDFDQGLDKLDELYDEARKRQIANFENEYKYNEGPKPNQ